MEYLHKDVRQEADGTLQINVNSAIGELTTSIACWLVEYHNDLTREQKTKILDEMILSYLGNLKLLKG
jgi:hypothetical protein